MILLMGIAGAGKGTQGQLLAEQHGYHVVTMGDVVRQTATDEQRQRMLAGNLLGDDEIMAMIDTVLSDIKDLDHVILDGFPRTLEQAKWLLEQSRRGRFTIQAAIHLIASREAVTARLLDRARADDNTEAIEQRFEEYERSTAPILEWLDENSIFVISINAERSVEDVNAEIFEQLNA
jgi:adenylate kinase